MTRKYAEIFCWKNVSSFCSAKATHIFSAKNIRILYIESAKTFNEMTLNELVKLTTLWTTGPWFCFLIFHQKHALNRPISDYSYLSVSFYTGSMLKFTCLITSSIHPQTKQMSWSIKNTSFSSILVTLQTRLHQVKRYMLTTKVRISLCIYAV